MNLLYATRQIRQHFHDWDGAVADSAPNSESCHVQHSISTMRFIQMPGRLAPLFLQWTYDVSSASD
jgi:hypothetical protein